MSNKKPVLTKVGSDHGDKRIEYFLYDNRVVGRRRDMPYPSIYELYLDGEWVRRPLMDWDTNADSLTEEDALEWIATNAPA